MGLHGNYTIALICVNLRTKKFFQNYYYYYSFSYQLEAKVMHVLLFVMGLFGTLFHSRNCHKVKFM